MIGSLKHVLELVCWHSGTTVIGRRLVCARTLVLAYHNVVPDGAAVSGDTSLHLPQSAFRQQLDLLASTCEVVPLDALSGSVRSRGPARPRVVITFDDAYSGAVTAGLREVGARGLPATVFVAPGFVPGKSFWWDSVRLEDAGPRRHARRHALIHAQGDDALVRRWAAERRLRILSPPPHAVAASEAELQAAAQQPGITFGSHTWSHPNLATLSHDHVVDELRRPLQWLRDRFANVIPWLAYPYGLCSPTVRRLAAETGYTGAVRVGGGWVAASPADRLAIPRLNVPAGMSLAGFALRTSGVI